MPRPSAASIDEYLAALEPAKAELLGALRLRLRNLLPTEVTECISYQMPALRLERVFLYYAAFKDHLGIFPPVTGDAALAADLAPYRGPRGNLRFAFNKPIPWELIDRVALALFAEFARKAK